MRSTNAIVAGILAMIRTVGALVGATDKAELLARSYEARLAAGGRRVEAGAHGRSVYFRGMG